MSAINITFAGDFYFSPLLAGKKPGQIISSPVKKIFENSDYSVLNLEAPICEPRAQDKIVKTGPYLHNSQESIDILKYLDINLACLANNHILDYGSYGIKETLKLCRDNKIETIGAGLNLEEASHIHTININNKKIAFVNATENEWSVATKQSAGANPYDIVNIVYQIQQAKKDADVAILVIHGGHEFYTLPSPRMKKVYRFFVDSGADAVIGHHTHCYSGHEIYKTAPIFYSLGNFIFPLERVAPDQWYKGILVNLKINEENKIDFDIQPYIQCKSENIVSTMPEPETEVFYKICQEKEAIIKNDEQLLFEWENFIKTYSKYYYNIFATYNLLRFNFFKKIFYKLGLKKVFLHSSYLKDLINAVQCEAHRDFSLAFLNEFLNEGK